MRWVHWAWGSLGGMWAMIPTRGPGGAQALVVPQEGKLGTVVWHVWLGRVTVDMVHMRARTHPTQATCTTLEGAKGVAEEWWQEGMVQGVARALMGTIEDP